MSNQALVTPSVGNQIIHTPEGGNIIIAMAGAVAANGAKFATGTFNGDGSTTAFDMVHNIGRQFVKIAFWVTGGTETDAEAEIDHEMISATTARTKFVSPFPSGWSARWVAIG
jgi:hypothetical protein